MGAGFRYADPHHFNADPDPVFHFNADPDPFHSNANPDPFHSNANQDPAFHFDADADPDPHQRDGNLTLLLYKFSRALFLGSRPQL